MAIHQVNLVEALGVPARDERPFLDARASGAGAALIFTRSSMQRIASEVQPV